MSWGLWGMQGSHRSCHFGKAQINGGHLNSLRIDFQIKCPTVLAQTLKDENTSQTWNHCYVSTGLTLVTQLS